MTVRDDRSDVKQTTAGFRGPLMVQSLTSANSVSGNSPNVINAVKLAKKKGGTTIGLTGFDGGKLGEICDHVIHVKSKKGEYGPVEDIHMIMDHMITSYLIMSLKKNGATDKRRLTKEPF